MRCPIQELSKKHGKPFIWKFSATSLGKGIVDGVGGKLKSSVHKKVMSLGKDRPIVQDSESFAKLANELSESIMIIHVTKEEVSVHTKDSNPFDKSVPIHGISKMHIMKSDGTKFVDLVQLFIQQGRYQLQTSNSLSPQNKHQVIKHQTKK